MGLQVGRRRPVGKELTGLTSGHVTPVVAGDDPTFQDIFRDFSHMASHDPEKLSRQRFDRAGDGDDRK